MKHLLQSLHQTRFWQSFFGPKKYECVVYFISERSKWLGKPYGSDIVEARRFRSPNFASGYGLGLTKRFKNITWVVRDVESGEFVRGHLPPPDTLT